MLAKLWASDGSHLSGRVEKSFRNDILCGPRCGNVCVYTLEENVGCVSVRDNKLVMANRVSQMKQYPVCILPM